MRALRAMALATLVVLLHSGCTVISATGWIKTISWKIQGTCSDGQKVDLQGTDHHLPKPCKKGEPNQLRRYFEIGIANGLQKWEYGVWTDYPPAWFSLYLGEPVRIKLINGKVAEVEREVTDATPETH